MSKRVHLAYAFWSAATLAAIPALHVLFAVRARQGREIAARKSERFGTDLTPRPEGKLLWLHAASVGEALSLLELIKNLPPEIAVLFTTGTVTSADLLAERLPALERQAPVLHRFVPFDVALYIARFLNKWRPDAACFVESELWPNMLRACHRREIPTALINARLSPRSFERWRQAKSIFASLLADFDMIDAQSMQDAARITMLANRPVTASGNLKRAAPPLPVDAQSLALFTAHLGNRPRWLAASTHPSDDAVLAHAIALVREKLPDALCILAPRHPARGAELAARYKNAPRRSQGERPLPSKQVYIADTMGEMGLWYSLCPVVFMGKSFNNGGGQNPLEPARFSCALVCGPAMQNFADDTTRLTAANAMMQVASPQGLANFIVRHLQNPAQTAEMGKRAQEIANSDHDLPRNLAMRLAALMP